jgi:rRNA-processing protein FCF1
MKGRNLTVRVILDANFFLVPSKFKMDIFEELAKLLNQRFEPVLLSTTYEELLTMAEKGSPSRRRQASLALKLAEKCSRVNAGKSAEETNDDVILRVATEWKSPVATNDRELRKKLRARGIPVIFLRGKSRLELEGAL